MSIFKKESAFLRHEPCGQCGSKNNLGRYTDGHAWCFGCGYYEPAKYMPPEPSKTASEYPQGLPCILPYGCTRTLPTVAQKWLRQYQITANEVRDHDIQWCSDRQGLVFPIYDDENLIAYQIRHFDSGSKWTTKGNVSDILHIINLHKFPDCGILVVEDIVSAIKCARHIPTMPVFGNHLSTANIMRLKRLTDNILIWLDPDMKQQSVKLASSIKEVGMDVKVIYSNLDPKQESDERILYEVYK